MWVAALQIPDIGTGTGQIFIQQIEYEKTITCILPTTRELLPVCTYPDISIRTEHYFKFLHLNIYILFVS